MSRIPLRGIGTHLHDDIHGISVFLLALPKGSHVEGAEPQGQGTVEGEEKQQQGGQTQGHPGSPQASGWVRRQQCWECRLPPPPGTLTYKACG